MSPDKAKKTQGADGASASHFAGDTILAHLKRLLASPDFDATTMQRAFIEFVVEQALAGNDQDIKGYTIATEVFGRGEDFDQAIDPIVSIQANKLRRSLERYYLLSGREDDVRIEIPKGTYVPVFHKCSAEASTPSRRIIDQDISVHNPWPTMLIKPFSNLTGRPERDFLGAGFAAELALEINRFQGVDVLRYGHDGEGRRGTDCGARFIVDGSIREDADGIKVIVFLLDTIANLQIWSDTWRFAGDMGKIIAFQEKVASVVGAIVAGEQGIINRNLAVEAQKKQPTRLTTYEAILRYHEYDRTLSPQDFTQALAALEEAGSNEPECGEVWTYLARLYANIYSLEIPGFDPADVEKKALAYAEKGVLLNPGNQLARAMTALIKMLSSDLAAAHREIDLAYTLNPRSFYLMDSIGYIKTLLGDWQGGPDLIRKTIKHNPFYYKPVVHYALWLDWLRQGDTQNAWLETMELQWQAVFWYPLVKASTLGLLGKIEEGGKFARDLLELKPDFLERGRILIGRYIKFDDIAAQVIEGLAAVGVRVR